MLELALISTTLFSFLIGIMTFAILQASDLSGANAAREGARRGILNYACADAPRTGCSNPNPALTAITAAVTNRLGGLVVGSPTVTVTCFDGTATPLVAKNCDPAIIVSDVDLLRVTVNWTRLATTAWGTTTTHTDQATMVIQGSGQSSPAPPACAVTSASVSPTQASLASGQTSGPLSPSTTTITITANTNGFCNSIYISFITGATPDQSTATTMTASGSSFTFTITASQYNWAAGTYNMVFSDGNGGVYSISPTPTVTISTAVCSITAASVSPSAAVITGSSPGHLGAATTVSVTTTPACTTLTTTFAPNGTPTTVTMTGPSPNFTLNIGANDYSWSPGAKQFTFWDSAANVALQTPQSVILLVASKCAVSVSWSPTTMSSSSIGAVSVTATPAASADCTNLSMTYAYGNSQSATVAMTLSGSTYTYSIPSSTSWKKGTWAITFSVPSGSAVASSPNPIYEVIT